MRGAIHACRRRADKPIEGTMTVGRKLTIGYAGLLAVAGGLAVAGLDAVRRISGELETASNVTSRKIELISEIRSDILTMRLGERGILLFSTLKLDDKVKASRGQFQSAWADLQARGQDMTPLLETDEGRRVMRGILENGQKYAQIHDGNYQLCLSGRVEEAIGIDAANLVAIGGSMTSGATGLMKLQHAVMQAGNERARETTEWARGLVIVLIVIALMTGVVVAFVLRQTTRGLRSVVAELTAGSGSIADAAKQVSVSSQSLADSASRQAASIEETSAAAEEITAITQKNTEAAHESAELLKQVSEIGAQTLASVEQMAESVAAINRSSGEVARVLHVIDEIAFQTNILALNAAVEAARAGEAGMGFAVVADEVRTLAQRCAEAAKKTAELIDHSVSQAHDGQNKVGLVKETMKKRESIAGELHQRADSIATSSGEQARGICEIGRAVNDMSSVTQGTAAHAEQSAAASTQLANQAGALASLAGRLETMVGRD
jgi:methyl-accepting chemotaxis protein/methyl-accepting chemotaxis protein-1 (serine sensor receptor)